MISNLTIKNYILIKDVEIEFEHGLNIISGESGAGKSIIISALSFVLGNRTDKSVVMPSSEFCKVDVIFTMLKQSVLDNLTTLGVECEDGVLVLSRKLFVSGKSEIRANGQLINLGMLKAIAQDLLEIYGQHAYQVLLDESKHIDFVDAMIETDLRPKFDDLKLKIDKKRELETSLKKLCGDSESFEREKQMLTYQVEEIEKANLKNHEDVELLDNINKMKHTQKVFDSIDYSLNILNESDSNIINGLFDCQHKLNNISNIDSEIASLNNRIESARIELDDICESLHSILGKYNFSEEDFRLADERMDLISSLKRKYGQNIGQVLEYKENAQKRLFELENSEELIEKFNLEIEETDKQIRTICKDISYLRKKTACELEERLIFELETLGIKDAKFVINFENSPVSYKGSDKVVFMFSANKGQNLASLSKVASGGEMSRFMLAFDIIFGLNKFGTLIFDEIDTGISGEVSNMVAKKMYALSKINQIIAITHLPTLCAMADVNFKVSKTTNDNITETMIEKLDKEDNIKEIARLTGVISYSKIAIQNAEELKIVCNSQKLEMVKQA